MRRTSLLAALLCILAPTIIAQDPVQVDSKHYTVLLENESVRVLKIRYGAKEKSVMHEHPDAIAVFMDKSTAKFNMPDGTSTPSDAKAGEVRFTPAGKHLPENVGGKPFEVILVELKGGSAASPASVALDAAKVDPERHKVEFENDRVRVLRAKFKARDRSKEHEHPKAVAIFLTDIPGKITLADGTTSNRIGKRGEVMWLEAEKHTVENPSDKAAEVILVELKK